MKRVALTGFLWLFAGCAYAVPIDCDDSEWQPGGLSCASVSSAVRPLLVDIVDVTHLSVAYEQDCPSGGQCPPAWGTVTVTAHVAAGEPKHFLVVVGNDGLVDADPLLDVPNVP